MQQLSFNMQQLSFKRYKYYSYGSSRKYESKRSFYEQFLPEKDLISILKVIEPLSCPAVQSAHKINAFSLPLKISKFGLWLKKGRAHFSFSKRYNNIKHEVKIYRQKIGAIPYFLNIHFINDRLLYVNACFHENTPAFEASVRRTIEKKYCCSSAEAKSFMLQDATGQKLKVDSDIYLNLYYITNDRVLLQEIKDAWYSNEASIIKLKQRPLLQLEDLL